MGVSLLGGDDVPAAAHPAVHLTGGGVEVPRETKGGAAILTGPGAVTEGSTAITHLFLLVLHKLSQHFQTLGSLLPWLQYKFSQLLPHTENMIDDWCL